MMYKYGCLRTSRAYTLLQGQKMKVPETLITTKVSSNFDREFALRNSAKYFALLCGKKTSTSCLPPFLMPDTWLAPFFFLGKLYDAAHPGDNQQKDDIADGEYNKNPAEGAGLING